MKNMIGRTLSVHQEHEFLAKLEIAGLNSTLAQNVIVSTNNTLAGEIVTFLRNRQIELSESQRNAQKIMGKNFFGVSEATLHFGINPTSEQLSALTNIPYSVEVLEECKSTHILVAIFPISILEIREKLTDSFYSQSWYDNESFASQRGRTSWQLVRKTAVFDSFSKNWAEQQALLGKDEEVPDVRIMVQTIIGHFLATGERIFPDKYARTKSLDSDGYRVYIRFFDSDGLYLFHDLVWVGHRLGDLGLASSRKFRPIEVLKS